MQRQLVSYKWSVVPVEIQDKYKVTLEAVFETNVPAPVVTMEPAILVIPYSDKAITINVRLTNHGLIAAKSTKLNFPESKNVYFEPLIQDIGDLPAMTSIVVPVIVHPKSIITRDSSKEDECLFVCAEYVTICNITRRNLLCDAIKVLTELTKIWNKIKSGVNIVSVALVAVDIIPGIPKDVKESIKNIKGLIDSAINCAAAAGGDASSMLGCMQLGCNVTSTYNGLCDLLINRNLYNCEKIKQDQTDECYCSLASAAFGDVGDTAENAPDVIKKCFCGAKLKDEFNGGLWISGGTPEIGAEVGFVEYIGLCDNNPKK